MKRKFLVIVIILSFFIGIAGCREMKRLTNKIYDFVTPYKAIGAYQEGVLYMFLVNTEAGVAYFDIWKVKSGEDNTWFLYEDGTFSYQKAYFTPTSWDNEEGIMGTTSLVGQRVITKREFKKGVKPYVKILLQNGMHILNAMRPIAVELGYIEVPIV